MNWPADVPAILAAIIATEGGYVNNPSDLGGPTKFGITFNTLSAWRGRNCGPIDIQELTSTEAGEIYKSKYIDGPGFGKIENLHVLYAVADTAVLFGPDRAARFLQTALGVAADGVCGAGTVAATNSAPDPRKVVNSIAFQRIGYHVKRVQSDPSQLQFLGGWVSRAGEFIE